MLNIEILGSDKKIFFKMEIMRQAGVVVTGEAGCGSGRRGWVTASLCIYSKTLNRPPQFLISAVGVIFSYFKAKTV